MPQLPTGTVTFLFTDVEGSTRLLHSLGAEAYVAALAEHRRLIREACAAEGGVEVDTQGDAFFFAFPTAPGALAAAAAFTEALEPVQTRMDTRALEDLALRLSMLTGIEQHIILDDILRVDHSTGDRLQAGIIDAVLDRYLPTD